MSELDPVLAKAIEGLSMREIDAKIAATPDLHGFARMANFDPARKPEETATIRKLMNGFGAAKYCGNTRCIRAGECMHPKVRCFWEHFYVMQRVVFPAMARKLKEMEARGEAPPHAEEASDLACLRDQRGEPKSGTPDFGGAVSKHGQKGHPSRRAAAQRSSG